jgi:molybdenum cofactor cytidylyltransferase
MPEQRIFAIVLAAGESSRFGSTKQVTEFDGESLAGRSVRLAEDVCGERTVLVVGNDWERVLAACSPLRGFFVRNEFYESGIASSIACGVKSVAHTADAALLLMADQPLITADHLHALIGEWLGGSNTIVASEYAGVRGPPVVFSAQCFDGLMNLEGDQGARPLMSDGRFSVTGLACDAAAVDIDTPDDLAKLDRDCD